jgi:hypothetical protein
MFLVEQKIMSTIYFVIFIIRRTPHKIPIYVLFKQIKASKHENNFPITSVFESVADPC